MSLFQTNVISDEDEKFGNLGPYMYNKTQKKRARCKIHWMKIMQKKTEEN